MPFPKQDAKGFNRTSIEALKPDQIGVYGLFKTGSWVYIGRGDIRARLLDHLNGDNPCIVREEPTHWVNVVTTDSVEREKALIIDCYPICNQSVG